MTPREQVSAIKCDLLPLDAIPMRLPVVSLREYCLDPVRGCAEAWTVIRRSDGARRIFTPSQFAEWFGR